jgi:flagellar P-ring protein precursor FlgI
MTRLAVVKFFAGLSCVLMLATTADARILLKSICRVKGMEEVTLQGLGIVVGLKGTGDGSASLPTIRAMARTMELMGMPLSPVDEKGQGGLRELKEAKNIALVMVTATIPAGAQRGDSIDCQVSALSAKSLVGGRLFMTPLLGPDVKSRRVYAIAQGQLALDDAARMPAAANVHGGARLEESFPGPDFGRGKLVLILDRDRADYQVASDIAELLNTQLLNVHGLSARAIDHTQIEVPIPQVYLDPQSENQKPDPVFFVSQVLSQSIPEPETEARVVINERAQTIVIGGDVEIGATVVMFENVVVETGEQAGPRFVAVDPERRLTQQQPTVSRLQALIEALNAVRVPKKDMIEIIKGIDRNGKLHARLIIE